MMLLLWLSVSVVILVCSEVVGNSEERNSLSILGSMYGRQYRLESFNYRGRYVRHRSDAVRIDLESSDGQFQLDSTWNMVPGACAIGLSIIPINYPDRLVRHKSNNAFVHRMIQDNSYRQDACWIPRAGLADSRYVSFESVNFPGMFLRHKSYGLRIDRIDGSAEFSQDATWVLHLKNDRQLSGKWHLFYSLLNPTGGTYVLEKEEGIEVSDSSSITISAQFNWGHSLEQSASLSLGISASMKTMYEESGFASASQTTTSTWSKFTKTTERQDFPLTAGVPFLLWQWSFGSITTDGTYTNTYSNIYTTSTGATPAPLGPINKEK